MIQMLYFAWVRERMGMDGETVTPPDTITTLATLVDWLAGQDAAHDHALSERARLRAAVDGAFAPMDTPIAGAREIALFPPVTGG